ncbi:uncharacterized protein RB166_012668 [Leptodactylus fuscus]|uniref:uncharacterized protein LOC142209480 n=1 Tax=Leptodactylus fuscus TaxID=238119 RepID=UPI003F4F0C22
MKILVSSLLLLFLAGTHGGPISEQAAQRPSVPSARDSIKSMFRNLFVYGAEIVANWESSDTEREAVLNKRVEIIYTSYFNLAYGATEYLSGIFTELAKELNETYPVFYSKVPPIFIGVFQPTYECIRDVAKEIKPHFEKFEEEVKKLQSALWEEVRPTIQSKAKPIIDDLNAKLKPIIEDVRKEVEAAQRKEDSEPSSEQGLKYADLEESIKLTEFVQKIMMFDKGVLKTILTNLELFSTNA